MCSLDANGNTARVENQKTKGMIVCYLSGVHRWRRLYVPVYISVGLFLREEIKRGID